MNLNQATAIICSGKILLCNTDTVPGLSCDATNADAVRKIIEIKKRDHNKLHFVVLVASDSMLNTYISEVPELAWDMFDLSTTPLTLVLEGAQKLSEQCTGDDGSVAIRYIKQGPLKDLILKSKLPIVSTSANISGKPSPLALAEVAPEITKSVDAIWDCEMSGTGKASTIIKLKNNGEFNIIRP